MREGVKLEVSERLGVAHCVRVSVTEGDAVFVRLGVRVPVCERVELAVVEALCESDCEAVPEGDWLNVPRGLVVPDPVTELVWLGLCDWLRVAVVVRLAVTVSEGVELVVTLRLLDGVAVAVRLVVLAGDGVGDSLGVVDPEVDCV